MSAAGSPFLSRTRVKICGLTREQDVDAAVAAGADAVGFVLYEKSPRYVSAARAAELARRLPPFVTPVLLFVNAEVSAVAQACELLPQALLQFHGDETPAQCENAAGRRPFIRAVRVPLSPGEPVDWVKWVSDFSKAQALLLDTHVEGYGGGGKVFDWSRLPPSVGCHLVLSGGLAPANVTAGILQVRPRGQTLAVDVSSGVEADAPGAGTRKGIKDAVKIHQFVAAVRAADEQLARLYPHGFVPAT